MRPIRRPARERARIAAWAPGPGDFDLLPPGARTRTWIEAMPFSFAASATRSAAFIAAYGDASSFAALTTIPPVAFVIVSEPVMSVSVMMMLLYDAKMWATPQRGIVQASFGAPLGVGAPGLSGSSGPSSSPPSAAGGAGGCPFCRTRACSARARWRNRRRTYWERQSSFLFFSPYFFRSSFSALMRSASHGWEGRSNFARENFGSPNDSHLGRFLLLFLLFFFLLRLLAAGFLRLLRLRGFEGGLLRHADRQAGPPVGPRALPADLLARLVAHALVRSDHLHQADVVPQPHLDVGSVRVEVDSRLPVFRPVHHPVRERLAEVAQGRLDLVRILLRQVAEAIRPRDAGEGDAGLGDADPDAGDRGERVRDGPGAVEVRVRHADDVPEVLLDALELLRRAGRFRLLFRLFLLPRGPLSLLGLRWGRRGFSVRAWLLLRH